MPNYVVTLKDDATANTVCVSDTVVVKDDLNAVGVVLIDCTSEDAELIRNQQEVIAVEEEVTYKAL